MTIKWLAAAAMCTVVLPALAQDALKSDKDKLSYGIGADLGRNLKRLEIEVDPELVRKGLLDALSGAKPMMSEEEVRGVLTGLQAQIQRKAAQAQSVAGEENKKAGE